MQARVEAVLDAPVGVEAAQPPTVDPRALWDRMEAHGISQNETARRAGISSALLSQIMNGKRTPSGKVLEKLHGVLFQPSTEELVVPAEVKVMAWKKGGRNGVVVRGAGGLAVGLTAAPSASGAGCPGAPRWSTPTAPGTTAGAGCR